MPIDLYTTPLSPPARAVHMTLKRLNIDANIIEINLQNGDHLKPEFLKLNPQHCVPFFVDDGFSLTESRAIMQYLVSKYAPNSPLYPTGDLKKRAHVDRLLYYDMSVWYAIRDNIMNPLFRGEDPHPNAVKNYYNNLSVLNTYIGDNKYVAGDELTIADLSFLASLTMLSVNDYKDLEDYSNVKRWFNQLKNELPYFDEINGKVPQLMKELANSWGKKRLGEGVICKTGLLQSETINGQFIAIIVEIPLMARGDYMRGFTIIIKMTIDLYFLQLSPPARAVLMTCKQLGIDVNVINLDFIKGEHLSPEYVKLNPAHQVPTIVDNEFVLYESRAIMQYLCNKYEPNGALYPSEPKKRALVDRWLNTDMSYFMANRDRYALKIVRGIEPTEQTFKTFETTLKLLDQLIGDNKYLAGDQLTIADLSVLASTTLLAINDYVDFDDHPNLKRWFETLANELPYFDEINQNIGQKFKELGEAIKSQTNK
ncbi:uncharacterized protein LOC128958177 [Oppia nitens]|uniref:uncharacterized protein LOC128958177 n=1 Tax=Oppia nitens TaxID=1686743 RepID=UPI0023DA71F4|nr:uncharacterized protein LOC128958177 [Oppia nitens]